MNDTDKRYTQIGDNHPSLGNSVYQVFRAEDFSQDYIREDRRQLLAAYCNNLLERRGTRVYGAPDNGWTRESMDHDRETHTALLVAVEPLRKESAEDVLREIVTHLESGQAWYTPPFIERARKVLEGR